MVQALRLNTMSKLTFADSSRFDSLVKDVFSGVDFTEVDDQILMNALEQAYKEARLELIPSQVCVCVCKSWSLNCSSGGVLSHQRDAGENIFWALLCAAEEGAGAE